MRVVLDTNILISACLKPDGLEAQLVSMVLAGTIIMYISPVVWAEYHDVLYRPKFAALRAKADEMLTALAAQAIEVTTTETLSAATDEDDNRFLECARAANVNYLITGNLKHYPPEHEATKIVNARQFFTEIESVCGSASPPKITETG